MLNDEQLDIVCITETWLKSTISDSLLLPSNKHTIFRKDRAGSLGGGVCVITNNTTVKAVQVDIPDEFVDLDIVCIDIVGTLVPARLIIGYRPPASDTPPEAVSYMKHFINCLSNLTKVDASVAIVGDFNLPSIDWSDLQFAADNDSCSSLFSLFVARNCFNQLVNEPTRLHPGSKNSVLDVILSNDTFVCDVTVSSPFSTSDHCSVYFSLVCPVFSCFLPDHEIRNFSQADWDSIYNFLEDCDWLSIFDTCDTAEQCSSAFYSKLNDAIVTFVPVNVFKSSSTFKRPCYPVHVRKLARAKSAAWRRYKQFKSPNLYKNYKTISSRLRKAIYSHVANREKEIIQSGNLGKFFRYSNNKFNHKPSIGPLQDEHGFKIINPQDKAALLSNYFQTQFTTDNGVLPGSRLGPVDSNLSSIVFSPVLVSRIIKKLNCRSAGGPDGIPPAFMKKLVHFYANLWLFYSKFYSVRDVFPPSGAKPSLLQFLKRVLQLSLLTIDLSLLHVQFVKLWKLL